MIMPHKRTWIRVQANLTWTVAQDPETGRFVGVCDALNLSAIGETWVEFGEAANEAIGLLLSDLFEDGELEGFLREKGWTTDTPIPQRDGTPKFDVPFNVVQRSMQELVTAR